MSISSIAAYIEKLQKLQEKYGDLEVVVDASQYTFSPTLLAADPSLVVTPKTNPRVLIE